MRSLLVAPLVLVVVGLAGWLIVRGLGRAVVLRDMLLAGGLCLAAAELACVPVVLARRASQGAVAQAGLVGTLVHLLGCLAVAAVVYLTPVKAGAGFMGWLLAFYWSSLLALVVVFVRAVKTASPSQTAGPQ